MPGFIGFPELLLLAIVVLLIFGPKRLPEMARSLGKGMREFKDSVTGDERPAPAAGPAAEPAALAAAPVAAAETKADAGGLTELVALASPQKAATLKKLGKAAAVVGSRKEQIQGAVERTGKAADARTGGRFHDRIERVGEQTDALLERAKPAELPPPDES